MPRKNNLSNISAGTFVLTSRGTGKRVGICPCQSIPIWRLVRFCASVDTTQTWHHPSQEIYYKAEMARNLIHSIVVGRFHRRSHSGLLMLSPFFSEGQILPYQFEEKQEA